MKAVRHAILGLLCERGGHAYEITARFNHRFGEVWSLNRGQTHATLAGLEGEGLITHSPVERANSKIRAIYAITEAGIAEFEGWMRTSEPQVPRPMRSDLVVKMAFAQREHATLLLELVSERALGVSEALSEHMQAAGEALLTGGRDEWARVLPELARGYEIYRLEAELEWLGRVRACLMSFSRDGVVPQALRISLLGRPDVSQAELLRETG